MTLYHFGNCLALIYVPYHMAYKFSGISEYGSFSKCVHAGGLYIFTQLCKMLLLATFFPDSDNSYGEEKYNVFMEVLKATVDFADLFGIYLALNSVSGKGHAKILTAAIGWASAEMLVTRSIPLWVGARGSEFSWRHVRSSAAASVSLVSHAGCATLVWLHSRKDLPARFTPAVVALLALVPFRALLEDAIITLAAVGPWAALGLKAAVAGVTGLIALKMYAHIAVQNNM